MRRLGLLSFVVLISAPAGASDASLTSAQSDLAIPPTIVTTLRARASPTQVQGKKKPAGRSLQAAQPAPPLPEPKLFELPPPSRIVPNGILSAGGSVRPIVASGAPIVPSGVLSIPDAVPAIYWQPVDPATSQAELARLELAQFLYDDYPAQLREFDSQIAITQSDIAALELRLANYARFDKFINQANPLFESQQRVNVALVEARRRLTNLQIDRGRLQQWLPVEIRRRQLTR